MTDDFVMGGKDADINYIFLQLIICYHMNAAAMCEFSKEEFTSGMVKMGCDSVEKLKAKLPDLR